jgi:hypothetical protein
MMRTPLGLSREGRPFEERFWLKVNKTETCWLWTGGLDDGYGKIIYEGRLQRAHRAAYQAFVGAIPPGMQVDHKCRVRHCVRVDHMQVVAQALNAQNKGVRSDSLTGIRGVTYVEGRKAYRVRAADPATGRRVEGGFFEDIAQAEARAIALRNELMSNNLQDRQAG